LPDLPQFFCNCADLLAAFGYFLEDGWGLRLWCTSDRHFEAITDRNHKITSDIFSGLELSQSDFSTHVFQPSLKETCVRSLTFT
jgi:hypothetical protein